MIARRVLTNLSLATLLATGAVAAQGCAPMAARRIQTSQETISEPSANIKEFAATEKEAVADVLVGEVHTVYPNASGLARVFGQVANLGETPYAKVRFDLVSEETNSETDGVTRTIVGSFVTADLNPGDIEPFDAQTSAPMGDVKTLKVVVYGAARE